MTILLVLRALRKGCDKTLLATVFVLYIWVDPFGVSQGVKRLRTSDTAAATGSNLGCRYRSGDGMLHYVGVQCKK